MVSIIIIILFLLIEKLRTGVVETIRNTLEISFRTRKMINMSYIILLTIEY
jgi:hypothetical protein